MNLDLGCQTGKIVWINPEEERAISFHDRKRAFKICVDSLRAGAGVYRVVEGSTRTLLSANSEPGRIGCLESECKHVTLLVQTSNNNTLEYNYTTTITNSKRRAHCDIAVSDEFCFVSTACPKCTSHCQRECFCYSQYGKVFASAN